MSKLWLDDLRPAPEGWLWVRGAQETIGLLRQAGVEALSLDHDLGDDDMGNGYVVAAWLEEQAYAGNWRVVPQELRVHSANPVGAKNIEAAITRIEQLRSGKA